MNPRLVPDCLDGLENGKAENRYAHAQQGTLGNQRADPGVIGFADQSWIDGCRCDDSGAKNHHAGHDGSQEGFLDTLFFPPVMFAQFAGHDGFALQETDSGRTLDVSCQRSFFPTPRAG